MLSDKHVRRSARFACDTTDNATTSSLEQVSAARRTRQRGVCEGGVK